MLQAKRLRRYANPQSPQVRNATWALSNLCRGKPQPAFELVRGSLDVLKRLIYSEDEEVLTDTCWALSYLTDGSNDKLQACLESQRMRCV